MKNKFVEIFEQVELEHQQPITDDIVSFIINEDIELEVPVINHNDDSFILEPDQFVYDILKEENLFENEQGVVEGGPFSYGAKKPRRGSVAANAEQKRKEQERNRPPIEPKDQMVGTAKVTKGVAEGLTKKAKARKEAEAVMAAIKRLEAELKDPNPHSDKADIQRRLDNEKRRLELYRDVLDEQGVVEGSDKTFTVVYYSKQTDRNVTKQIKASSESELWDRLRAKGIDVVSVKEQGVTEGILNELAPGFSGDGRWYTDYEIADIVGEDWLSDDLFSSGANMSRYGDAGKEQLKQEAQEYLENEGYSVEVLDVRDDEDHLSWLISGSMMRLGEQGVAEGLSEAKYQGREVKLGKPMAGDVKKYKVYVKDPQTGNIKKVNFGDKKLSIKRDQPSRRKNFRARHRCSTAKDRTSARYWSCRMWSSKPVSKILKGK